MVVGRQYILYSSLVFLSKKSLGVECKTREVAACRNESVCIE